MADKRTTYSRLREMLLDHCRRGHKELSFGTLEVLIIKHIGSNPRTITEAMRTMVKTKLLQDIGSARFRIVRSNLE